MPSTIKSRIMYKPATDAGDATPSTSPTAAEILPDLYKLREQLQDDLLYFEQQDCLGGWKQIKNARDKLDRVRRQIEQAEAEANAPA